MMRSLIQLFVCTPLALLSALMTIGVLSSLFAQAPQSNATPVVGFIASSIALGFAGLLGFFAWHWWSPRLNSARSVGRGKLEVSTRISDTDPLLQAATSIVRSHIHTLASERRKRLIPDRYGLADPTAWNAEVSFFTARVLQPHVVRSVSPKLLRRSLRKLARSILRASPSADMGAIFRGICAHVIETELAAFDETRAELSQARGYSTPAEFEQWCADELALAGWRATVNGQTGDQGVDVQATRNGIELALQCKMYSQPVGNSAVQEVFAGKAFYQAHVAAVISTAGFTRSARAIAAQTGVHLLEPEQLRSFDPRVGEVRSAA